MIVGRQIRAARALLDMSQDDLAEAAGLTPQAIRKIESGEVQPREGTIADIARVFDEHGVEFTENSGVKLKPKGIDYYEGQKRFDEFYDYIFEHLSEHPGNICIYGHSAKLFSKYRKDPDLHRRRMMQIKEQNPDFSVRTLNEVGDDYMPNAAFSEYKWQKKEFFPPISFYVFGSCVALISFEGLTPPYVILIKSALFAEAYKRHFDLAWELAEEPPKTQSPIRTKF